MPRDPLPSAEEWARRAWAQGYGILRLASSIRARDSAVRREALEEAAVLASKATMDPESRAIHPDVPFKSFKESAATVAHATAQAIAMDIRALADQEASAAERPAAPLPAEPPLSVCWPCADGQHGACVCILHEGMGADCTCPCAAERGRTKVGAETRRIATLFRRYAKESRKLAMECVSDKPPAFGTGWQGLPGDPACAIGHVIDRAGGWGSGVLLPYLPPALWAQQCAAADHVVHANNDSSDTDRAGAVVFPLLYLADELERIAAAL